MTGTHSYGYASMAWQLQLHEEDVHTLAVGATDGHRQLAARHHRSRHQLAMCTERPQLLGAQYGRCCVPPISTHLPDTVCALHAGVVFRVGTYTLTTSRLQL